MIQNLYFLNLFDFKKHIKNKLILDCVVFDNSISTIEQLKNSWVISIEEWKNILKIKSKKKDS